MRNWQIALAALAAAALIIAALAALELWREARFYAEVIAPGPDTAAAGVWDVLRAAAEITRDAAGEPG